MEANRSPFPSLRCRREWVSARTSVPNASAKSRAGREKNGEESSSATLRRKTFRALTHSRQLRRLAIPTFPLQGLTSIGELAFVCLTHDGGLKFRDVISALRYWTDMFVTFAV